MIMNTPYPSGTIEEKVRKISLKYTNLANLVMSGTLLAKVTFTAPQCILLNLVTCFTVKLDSWFLVLCNMKMCGAMSKVKVHSKQKLVKVSCT